MGAGWKAAHYGDVRWPQYVSESGASCNLEPSAWDSGMAKGLGKLDRDLSRRRRHMHLTKCDHSCPVLGPLGAALFHLSVFPR